MLTPEADGYGNLIDRHHRGLHAEEVIERDDGWFGVSAGAPAYFAPFEQWPTHPRRAIRLATGRVLDVGCGAGATFAPVGAPRDRCIPFLPTRFPSWATIGALEGEF